MLYFDNSVTIGTKKERGITAWQEELKVEDVEEELPEAKLSPEEEIRRQKVAQTVYNIPYINKLLRGCKGIGYIPVCPRYDPKLED